MRRRAFTLIEILVVIGIIALVVGITFGVFASARKNAAKASAGTLLATVRTAMDAYVADHGRIPIPQVDDSLVPAADRPVPATGAQVLVQALVAIAPAGEDNVPANQRPKADGQDGPGFKSRPAVKVGTKWVSQGQRFGPYLPVEKVKLSNPSEPLLAEILDPWGTPVDYIPQKLVNITKGVGVNAYAKDKYSLVSAGPDQKFGTADDIRNDP
jgi:prepilin-type N-terminal cleavage/methylation domain-containing protein